jgi:hypothetical protein
MFISIVIAILILIPTVDVFASSKPDFFSEDGYVMQSQEKSTNKRRFCSGQLFVNLTNLLKCLY